MDTFSNASSISKSKFKNAILSKPMRELFSFSIQMVSVCSMSPYKRDTYDTTKYIQNQKSFDCSGFNVENEGLIWQYLTMPIT